MTSNDENDDSCSESYFYDYSDEYEDFENYYNTDDYTPIFLAVHNGDLNGVRTLLNENNLEESVHNKRMLHAAAARGHLQIVDLLIKNGAEINVVDFKGRTPFYVALQQNKVDVAEFLLENGARIDIPRMDGETTLHVAIKTQNIQIVERLLKQGAMVNVLDDMSRLKPIDLAASLNNIRLVELLLKYGAKMDESDEFCGEQKDVHKRMTALHFAAKRGNLEMVKLLMSNGFDKIDVKNLTDKTPLGVAISKHRLGIVKYLFESGSKINEDIPLIDLCETDEDTNILKYLIDHGVKLVTDHTKTPLYFALDMHEYKLWRYLLTCYSKIDSVLCSKETELHSAVRANDIEKVQEILKKMKVNSLSGELGQFAVYIAVENGNEEMLTILLEAGCSVESCFRDKLSPLHIAATFEHTRLVEILLKYGARINSETRALYHPLDFAAVMENLNMIKYLVASGARFSKRSEIPSLTHVLSKRKTITPSMFQNILKITELLLIAGDLDHKSMFVVETLLKSVMNLKVSRKDEESSITDNENNLNIEKYKNEEFRSEIIRCLFNYLDNKLLQDVINLYLSHWYNNASILEIIIDYYDSKFLPEEFYFSGNNWNDSFIINEIDDVLKLLDILAMQDEESLYALGKNGLEVLKLITARLELFPPGAQALNEYFLLKEDTSEFGKLHHDCYQQIMSMQRTNVIDEVNLTIYDILVKSSDKLVNCIKDKRILNTIELSYDKFPTYAKFLKLRIEKAKRKIDLMDMSMNCLFYYIKRNFKIQLSLFDIAEILQYLSMSDLRKLSSAFS